jgi:hypothetical protein
LNGGSGKTNYLGTIDIDFTLFKSSVPTSQETHCISIIKTNWLVLFREIIAVYSENHTKHINTIFGQNGEFVSAKADGTDNNQCVLKEYTVV